MSPSERPNIIFILTDDQRADTLSSFGNTVCQTPNLDGMVSDGTLFENASVTSAICTPSRACFFLGQYERRHGINFNSGTAMAPEAWAQSFPVLLRSRGYYTGYVGKNHVPIGAEGYSDSLMPNSFDYWYAGHRHLTFYPKERHPIFSNAQTDTQVEVIEEGTMAFLDPASNDAFLDRAEHFLERRPSDKPFCLSVCFNLPHDAGTGTMRMLPDDPEIYRSLYRDQIDTLPLSPTYVAKNDIETPRLPPDVFRTELRQRGYDYVDRPETMRKKRVCIYQSITGIDRMIGHLRAKLDGLGIADNTILIFTSDHGIMQGDLGLGGKALCYEQCLHVPLVVMDPRLPAERRGVRCPQLVQSIDVAPTILGWAGIPVPEEMQGAGFGPLMRGETTDWRPEAFGENLWATLFGNPRCESVRTAHWKYIRYFENYGHAFREGVAPKDFYVTTPEMADAYAASLTASIRGEEPVHEELFYLATDPHETTNLATVPAHRQRLETLRRRCSELVALARGDVDAPPCTLPLSASAGTQMAKEIKQD